MNWIASGSFIFLEFKIISPEIRYIKLDSNYIIKSIFVSILLYLLGEKKMLLLL